MTRNALTVRNMVRDGGSGEPKTSYEGKRDLPMKRWLLLPPFGAFWGGFLVTFS